MAQAHAIVGQSGGPTSVINASLAGVIEAVKKQKKIGRLYGMHFGIEGVLNDDLFVLNHEPAHIVKGLRETPGSALGSSRLKLHDDHLPIILERLKQYHIRYFFLIGGNDTMDTIHRVVKYAEQQGYELQGVGIPKTVDNDLHGTDHTPGYPSAARYMILSVLQAGILARDMQRVDQFVIFQCIGRSAGWLPAATSLARRYGSAPHIILLPERPIVREALLDAVKQAHHEHGFVSIVCGEGIVWPDGQPVSSSETRDKFGNVEFGAMGGTSAAVVLHRLISQHFGWRGEFQIPESLPMCAADRTIKLDVREAYACGQRAVELAVQGHSGIMVTLQRRSTKNRKYHVDLGTIPLEQVANHARPLPDEYIAPSGMDVTLAFEKYIIPLVGKLPEYVSLKGKKARAE